VGRGHLARLAAAGAALALVAPASAGLQWRLFAHGIGSGHGQPTPTAYLALDLAHTTGFAQLLPTAGRSALARTDFTKDAVVAVFGEWGCTDHRIVVRSVNRRARTIVVSLVSRPPAPGTAECLAIYPTYRLLAIAKAQLVRPFPRRAEVTLARA
jgi:hypothetical protein